MTENESDSDSYEERPLKSSRIMRPLWYVVGWTALALAAAGAILPLLPTTPFLLVAAWAFGKCSHRWRRWIHNQPTFGPLVKAWERHGVIPIWGKVAALGTMATSFVILCLSGRLPLWALILIGATLTAVAAYIVSRPGRPPETAPAPPLHRLEHRP